MLNVIALARFLGIAVVVLIIGIVLWVLYVVYWVAMWFSCWYYKDWETFYVGRKSKLK